MGPRAESPAGPRPIMQSANAAAPKIIEALMTLGSADPAHIAFAMCGLRPSLQQDAAEAAKRLKKAKAKKA